LENKKKIAIIDAQAEHAAARLGGALFYLLKNRQKPQADVVFLCIGTDRATGDAFGPLVGSGLKNVKSAAIYGNLEEPVHAANISAKLASINARHKNPCIIAIDACLGSYDRVGKFIIRQGALAPGLAKGDNSLRVGDISIMGVVNIAGAYSKASPLEILASTRLNLVMGMAKAAAKGISNCLHRLF